MRHISIVISLASLPESGGIIIDIDKLINVLSLCSWIKESRESMFFRARVINAECQK